MFYSKGLGASKMYLKDRRCYGIYDGASREQSWRTSDFNGMRIRFLSSRWTQIGPESLGRWRD